MEQCHGVRMVWEASALIGPEHFPLFSCMQKMGIANVRDVKNKIEQGWEGKSSQKNQFGVVEGEFPNLSV